MTFPGLKQIDPNYQAEMLLRLRKIKNGKIVGHEQSITVTRADVADLILGVVMATEPNQRLFPFSYAHMRNLFNKILRRLNIAHLGFVMHGHRAGGATEGKLLGMPIDAIRERGIWASRRSAEHYVRQSAALLIFH